MFAVILLLTAFGVIHASPVFNSDVVLSDEKYPFVVKLYINDKTKYRGKIVTSSTYCTGFLITMNVVVTAAHCLDDEYGIPTVVVAAGAVDSVNGDVKKLKMIGYKKHKNYQPGEANNENVQNDIAVVWLEKKFDRSPQIAPAELDCGNEDYTNKVGTVVGWGDTGVVEDTTTLRKGQMVVLSASDCNKFAKQSAEDKTFCTMVGSRNQYPGEGDSGGPFVIDGAVVGLSSWLPTFKSPRVPKIGVFVRVEEYIDFLNYNLKNGPPNAGKPATGQSALKNACEKPPSKPASPGGSRVSSPTQSGDRRQGNPRVFGQNNSRSGSPNNSGGNKSNIPVQSGSSGARLSQGSSPGSKNNRLSSPVRKNNG